MTNRGREMQVQGEAVEIRVGLDDDWNAFTRADVLHGLDIETTAVDEDGARFWDPAFEIRLVQVATKSVAYVLRLSVPAEREAAIEFLSRDSAHFVTHSSYDPLGVAVDLGVVLGQRVVDTLLLAYLLEPGDTIDHTLKTLCSRHIDDGLREAEVALDRAFDRLPRPEGVRKGTKAAKAHGFNAISLNDPDYLTYAGLDAIYVRRLWDVLLDLCSDFSRLARMEQWLAAQTTGVSIRGLRLDVETVKANLALVSDEIAQARKRIETLCGFAALSPKRVQWLADRGVEFERMTEKGNPSLDKEALPGLLAKYGEHPEVGPMLRDVYTLSSRTNLKSNLAGFLSAADSNGRVHPKIHTLRAHTGRMSITAPAMQTLSKADPKLRGAFIADEGKVLISADFRNVELRVAAALSGEQKMIDAFLAGRDLHSVTAELIYGPGFTEQERAIGKKANFLTVYGGGANALHTQGGVPLEQARDVIDTFRKAYPTLTQYGWDLARETDAVVNDAGRRIPVDPDRSYANSNYMIQSTARDLLLEALYRFVVEFGHHDALWLLVHDELIVQATPENAEQVAADLQASMTTSYRSVPIEADVTILGERWGK